MPLAIAMYVGYGPISIGSILPCRFTYVPNLKIKILSLTEVIVFTRNGLHTYMHTYMHTHIHTYMLYEKYTDLVRHRLNLLCSIILHIA